MCVYSINSGLTVRVAQGGIRMVCVIRLPHVVAAVVSTVRVAVLAVEAARVVDE